MKDIIFQLLLTLAVELWIYSFADNFKIKSFVALFITNLVLNTTMNVTLLLIENYQTYLIVLIIFEVMVIAIESTIYYLFTKRKLWFTILVALAANATSFALGNVANRFNLVDNAVAFYILISLFVVLIGGLTGVIFYYYLKRKAA